jgi:hypothetical protein
MNRVLRNILGFILGVIIGSIVNGGLVTLGPHIVPYPEGMNPMDPESIAAHMDEFTTLNYLIPLIAHALGTLVGAWVAYKIAATHKAGFAYGVGVLFLVGGIINAFSLPAPAWFIAVDLIVAYIPMAWLVARKG